MRCLECQREVRNINFRHLKKCSGITPQEYLARHPEAQLVDADVRATYGLPMERNPKWRGGRAYRDCRTCGKRLSRHTKGEYCKDCQSNVRIGENNHFHGQKHTSETRKRMVESAKLRDRSTYRGGGLSSERLSVMRRQYWSTLSPDERATRLTMFIQAGQRHNKRSARTKVENAVADMLDRLNVTYQRNVPIGRCNVDFLVGRETIIECYGDYWHCNPALYEPDFYHRSLHFTAAEKWQHDQVQQRQLTEQGYDVHVIWERDIQFNAVAVFRTLTLIVEVLER